ncbi:MAG: lipid-binding SYLF domain-containing protein [Candidatus Methylomirabilia bacterium]
MKWWQRSFVGVLVIVMLGFGQATAEVAPKLVARFEKASAVLREVMSAPDRRIPQDLLDRAYAVAVFPGVVKGAFFFGGRGGKGIMSVRRESDRRWSAPAFFTMGGASFGLQIGAQVTDFVLLVMTWQGVDSLLRSKVTLGGDLSVAAGPVGRRGEVGIDVRLQAAILSYSRTKGLFGGVSLEGTTIFADGGANRQLYGSDHTAREILLGGRLAAPDEAKTFLTTLSTYAPAPKP